MDGLPLLIPLKTNKKLLMKMIEEKVRVSKRVLVSI